MMGKKERQLAPLINVSLEELVPQDHFYRHLERTLDLSFVRAFVQGTYAGGGRPSIDPIVFFKLQLVMFFEGIRSERLLMRHAEDRLSVRWFLGYDLDEPLPDHSSLTRIRTRYGVEMFRRFFEAIVDQCQLAGLVWGKELYFDATKANANASMDSVKPRFAVDSHLRELFATEGKEEPEHAADAPLPDFDQRNPFYGQREFQYDPERDTYTCPNGALLRLEMYRYTERTKQYRADAATCNACPLKEHCTESRRGRTLRRSFDEEYLE